MKIGILGHGELGQAIESLYPHRRKVCVKDKAYDTAYGDEGDDSIYGSDEIKDCDYLHVCIPYSDDFVDQVCECIEKETPKNVLIHSTVQVGTTRKIMEKSGLINICHAPVRGVHPNLSEGLTTFPMYIGFDDNQHGRGQRRYVDFENGVPNFIDSIYFLLHSLGIHIKVVDKFETSELAKIASTTYYGMCIAFHGEMQGVCSEVGLDFEEVMTEWNEGYNKGYKKLGMDNVVRPVLTPPDKKIGGHCVIPNAKLLQDFRWFSEYNIGTIMKQVTDLILKYE